MISRATRTKIVCKIYDPVKSTYQVTISGFTKLLDLTVYKVRVYALLTTIHIGEKFWIFSPMTKMEIVWKSYAPGKWTYQLSTLRFRKMLLFHIIVTYLGYIVYKGMVKVIFVILFSQQDLFNGLSSEPNRDPMQNVCPWEVDIPTYHFKVHKIVCVSSSSVIFRAHHI